jgi:hypothetical protein
MIDSVEEIGPVLGVVAFLGLAILAFLIFQQARDIRRLREWAGRAPERAAEAAEASLAAAEARGEHVEVPEDLRASRLARARERLSGVFGPPWEAIDRNLPVDPRYIVAVAVAALVAVGVLTSGFGMFGDEEGDGRGKRAGGGGDRQEQRLEVAVLNATQEESVAGPIAGVAGLATKVADQVVEPAGYRVGIEDDAPSGFEETVVMYEPNSTGDAAELARAINSELGETPTQPMIQEITDVAEGAPLALVIGQDDAEF